MKNFFCFILFSILLSGCAPAPQTAILTPKPSVKAQPTTLPTATAKAQKTQASGASPSPTNQPHPTYTAETWKEAPIIPSQISASALEIYRRGQALGNNPHRFIKVGDCDATPTWFLGDFDLGTRYYSLGKYQSLQVTIDYFQGSFSRESVAVKRGFNAAAVLSPMWADRSQCQKGETPLDCEIRINNPSFALILLGTNDIHNPEQFEPNLRKILEQFITKGIVPVLSTKADNAEGDYQMNLTIARLAQEYDLPLWNYWKAVQNLPKQGLQEDNIHLTFAPNVFDNPANLQAAWPWRNLTALQMLELMRQSVAP